MTVAPRQKFSLWFFPVTLYLRLKRFSNTGDQSRTVVGEFKRLLKHPTDKGREQDPATSRQSSTPHVDRSGTDCPSVEGRLVVERHPPSGLPSAVFPRDKGEDRVPKSLPRPSEGRERRSRSMGQTCGGRWWGGVDVS